MAYFSLSFTPRYQRLCGRPRRNGLQVGSTRNLMRCARSAFWSLVSGWAA